MLSISIQVIFGIRNKMDDKCFFDCSNKSTDLLTCGVARVETVRKCSRRRGDGLEDKLIGVFTIMCHKSCVCTYTSEHHIQRFLSKQKRKDEETDEGLAPKKARRSGSTDFNFKEHCLFCGEKCLSRETSLRHPDRWRKVVPCRTAGDFKKNILQTCELRNDSQAEQVRIRINGALSDLHAADGQYHFDCYARFTSKKNIAAVVQSESQLQKEDHPFDALVQHISENKSDMWNSIEVQDIYVSYGGNILSRRNLIDQLVEHFGNDLLILSGNGVASILVFRSRASHLLKMVDDKADIDIKPIAKVIRAECLERPDNRETYKTRLFVGDAQETCSDLLLQLLAMLSPKLDHTNPALLIGNIITSVITNRPTTLQIALGTLLHSKSLIEHCAQFGISCSYPEILRFKKSVAYAASKERQLQGLKDSKFGIIQAVADNFDANVSSPNGLKSTHSLALLFTQLQDNEDCQQEQDSPTVRRLSNEELKGELEHEVRREYYNGPKKPSMPEAFLHQVLPLNILAAQVITRNRAQSTDYLFFCEILNNGGMEFNGFNTKMARMQGHAIMPSTKAIYTPLIDMKPSDPDTIMTAMVESQRMTGDANQTVTLFTADQQLYRVAVDVLWVYPQQFPNFIPRLGGMHMLMSFVGSVGTLMANSGLEELMNSAFGGVMKMLSGKKFPQNLRALRMVVEELLRSVIPTTQSFAKLMENLEERFVIILTKAINACIH